MPFKPISPEEVSAKHMDDYFWYVLNLRIEPPEVITNPFVDKIEESTFIFQEKEDAETFAYVLSRTPAYQDEKLGIQSDKYSALIKDVEEEEMGRFPPVAISHEEAQRMFEHYEEILKTRDLAEDPELHKPEER
jgi:hypothetical protein